MSLYKPRELPVSVNTRLAALIGWPLGHSASSEMHNDAYAAMGLDALYLPLPIAPDNLKAALDALADLGFIGCNVTIPYKIAVKDLMDELSPSAEESGAVNTVYFHEGRKIGYNTDGTGFVHALREKGGFEPRGKTCLIVGAGGAARGVASALAIAETEKFIIANRAEEYEMAEALAADMNTFRPGKAEAVLLSDENIAAALRDADFVVHATRLGMSPHSETVAFDPHLLSPRHMVCDVVYSPRETTLLREADQMGCRTLGGVWMLIYQGAEAIRIWTGLNPPIDVMEKGCTRFLDQLESNEIIQIQQKKEVCVK